MFTSFSRFLTRLFNTLTKSIDSVEKILDIGNDYITNTHKQVTRTTAKTAILNTARQHLSIQDDLKADANLATIFNDLEAEWN